MIRLKALSKNQNQIETANGTVSAAVLRITKDINELSLSCQTCDIRFPEPDDLFHFELIISPNEGFYKDGHFEFEFHVPKEYPFEAPKVKCRTEIYHPNIDLAGNVCLNILREDWKPVLTIGSVIHGLQFLLLEPNSADPLNKAAAEVLRFDSHLFGYNVRRVMAGKISAKVLSCSDKAKSI